MRFFAPTGGLCTACRNNSNNKQIRNIVRFFSRISGGPGDGPQIVRFFSRISGGPGDGPQIVRFFELFPGFPGVPGAGARMGLRL